MPKTIHEVMEEFRAGLKSLEEVEQQTNLIGTYVGEVVRRFHEGFGALEEVYCYDDNRRIELEGRVAQLEATADAVNEIEEQFKAQREELIELARVAGERLGELKRWKPSDDLSTVDRPTSDVDSVLEELGVE